MARPGIEPRTSDLRVSYPTDCATGPGVFQGNYVERALSASEHNRKCAGTFLLYVIFVPSFGVLGGSYFAILEISW